MAPTAPLREVDTVTLDDHPPVDVVEVEFIPPPVQYLRSRSACLPDPAWTVTDSHGHEHRWAATGREEMGGPEALPTLAESGEHRACDGSRGAGDCGGPPVTVWRCAACGDPVKPGFVPDIEARTVGLPVVVGGAELTVFTTAAPIPGLKGVSPRGGHRMTAVLDGERYTGRGWVTEWRTDDDGDRYTVSLRPCSDPPGAARRPPPGPTSGEDGRRRAAPAP